MVAKWRAVVEKLSPGLRKIMGNVGWLFAERILTMVLAFCVGIWVIRYLGSENFGKLSYTTSFVALFSAIAQLGLNAIVIRNIVHEEKAAPEILGTAFVLKLIASLLTIIIIGIAIWTFDTDPNVRWMTLIIAFSLMFSAFDAIEFWFQSQVLSGVLAILRSVQLIMSSLIKLSFIAFKLPLMAFVWLILAEQVVKVLGMLWVYPKYHQSMLRWRFNWSKGWQMLQDSWPLILSGVMITIYMKIDQVMLGNMANAQAVGNYGAAVRFSEIWYFIPMAVCSSVFPAILRAKQRSGEEYYARLQQLYDLMAWMALSIAIPMTFASVPLLTTLLGKEFAEAGTILAWHIWAGPFVFLGVARSNWLMAENFTRFSFLTTSLGSIVNILLNFLLIPPYQGVGAAIATIIAYAVASHISCLLYPPMFKPGLMLTKALFIPFRFQQNLNYFNKIKQILI
ncbi:MAG: flippase [Microcystis panniformis Mp_MB_F_20051200_S6D]|nr:MAG: flippase [Microcystis panniformis Mp_MB_F_20080800_S26D]TRV52421.1 MAG: flippase [Microcystis panniformis Mp_GB_SS_20050300_S99]TRV53679.1 MAG: flippase [Microcystis panniformis Mp_GB_SS_20050300_S99D]TRV58155.1 MAG: flippase [Microcystis panniformis Mp_MB_F_20051200_S9D]TRV63344.1 MAG: flippase [Microcystis panniformis Mp_MB_F_20080800_S26]TRV73144.1 MAG: flippase [Microcystis panniformis Mp_MB_F_20051200_S6D]TRV75672.1 MAG: flippase [Microcystis panniformis Mp_MB_F_20051200_S6]